MTYVATEICDETGSWLSNYILSGAPQFPDPREFVVLGKRNKLYKELNRIHEFKTKKVVIRKLSRMEESLSYEIHTNRELIMMLSGKKPLSVFISTKGENYDIYNGQKFGKYKRKIKSSHRQIGDYSISFKFIDGEEWRVKAYCIAKNIELYLGNCPQVEAIQGELLGYSKEQNIEFINKFFK